jgi:hypothetical protein
VIVKTGGAGVFSVKMALVKLATATTIPASADAAMSDHQAFGLDISNHSAPQLVDMKTEFRPIGELTAVSANMRLASDDIATDTQLVTGALAGNHDSKELVETKIGPIGPFFRPATTTATLPSADRDADDQNLWGTALDVQVSPKSVEV